MSADNGIYILETPVPPTFKPPGTYISNAPMKEYRVAHCQAIENLDYSELYMPILFGNSEIYRTEQDAFEKAQNIQKQIEQYGNFTEYGIRVVRYDKHFPNITAEAAAYVLDNYVGAIPLDLPLSHWYSY